MSQTDQFFKALVEQYFRQLLEVFLPEVASQLNFETVRFLGTEVFTGWPRGKRRTVDVLAEVRTREGVAGVVVIHVEIQAQVDPEFRKRMRDYYRALPLKLELPIFPIALMLTPNAGGLTRERYVDRVLGEEVASTSWAVIGVRDLEEQAYATSPEPLAQALRGMMRTDRPRWEVVVDALRRIAESNLDQDEKATLAYLSEEYAPLTRRERRRLDEMKPVRNDHGRLVWMPSWERRSFEEWTQENRANAKRDLAKSLLERRFGALPSAAISYLGTLDTEALEDLLARSYSVETLAELGLPTAPIE